MPSKLEFTQEAIARLGPETEWQVDSALTSWWRNLHSQGLQLSITGYGVFLLAQFEHWEFELPHELVLPRYFLALDRALESPWTWCRNRGGRPTLVLFNSADAVMATLYGDLKLWLESLDHK
jgi:hypothetical protein